MSNREEFEIIRQIAWDAVGTNIETADKALVKIYEYAKNQAAREPEGGEAVFVTGEPLYIRLTKDLTGSPDETFADIEDGNGFSVKIPRIEDGNDWLIGPVYEAPKSSQPDRAQGDAEPVVYRIEWEDGGVEFVSAPLPALGEDPLSITPLYTHPPAAKVPDWTNRLNTCKHHGDDHEACAVYGGRVPCDAEGGEAVGVVTFDGTVAWFPGTKVHAGTEVYSAPQPDKWIPEGWKVLRMPELQKAISSGPVISLAGPNHETLTFVSDSDERRERDTYAFFNALLSAAPPEQDSE